jgi:uncharacterized OsmC-like protein
VISQAWICPVRASRWIAQASESGNVGAEQLPQRPDSLLNHPAGRPGPLNAPPGPAKNAQNINHQDQPGDLKMALQNVAAAVRRVMAAFQRRPEVGLHVDAPAVARWESGTRVVIRSTGGIEVATDMPLELGGSGDQVTPGWLFRAGIASCAATSITLAAACEGIELTALEVDVGSRSDARGLLGMSEPNGEPVYAGPFDVELRVTVAANGATPLALKTLVERCLGHSPVPSALVTATPFSLQINVSP